MHYLKNKFFTRWAREEGITDTLLFKAFIETSK